jgi:hypothetical protein
MPFVGLIVFTDLKGYFPTSNKDSDFSAGKMRSKVRFPKKRNAEKAKKGLQKLKQA